jgi:hypothetical protein
VPGVIDLKKTLVAPVRSVTPVPRLYSSDRPNASSSNLTMPTHKSSRSIDWAPPIAGVTRDYPFTSTDTPLTLPDELAQCTQRFGPLRASHVGIDAAHGLALAAFHQVLALYAINIPLSPTGDRRVLAVFFAPNPALIRETIKRCEIGMAWLARERVTIKASRAIH